MKLKTQRIHFFLYRTKAEPGATIAAKSYTHLNLCFKDLPGLGTAKYPDAKKYYKEHNLAKGYEAFFLFVKGISPLTSNLAKLLKKSKKPLIVIRSFMDEAEKKERSANQGNVGKDKLKQELKQYLSEKLEIDQGQIFLVSNIDPDVWQFEGVQPDLEDLIVNVRKCLTVPSVDIQSLKQKLEWLIVDKGKSEPYF